ncbi:helix-turn-helix transcriptional regulator [Agrobacterium tumefaciens]|uniref:helix-turn-helix transcriptional regulator n=2 Tax=Agrobacterium tumefaciens TaxID=358 RepID=UPI003CFCC4C2
MAFTVAMSDQDTQAKPWKKPAVHDGLRDRFALTSTAEVRSTEYVSGWFSREVSETFLPADTNVGLYDCFSWKLGNIVSYACSSAVARHLYYKTGKLDYMLSMDHGEGTFLRVGPETRLVNRDMAAFVRLDQVEELTAQPGSVAEGFIFPGEFIQRSVSNFFDFTIPEGFQFATGLDLNQSANHSLISLIRSFRDLHVDDASTVSPVAVARFEDLLSHLIIDNVSHNFSHRKGYSLAHKITPAQVKRALEFAKAHARDPITSSDMAKAAGVNLRTLQGNFQKFLGTTPIEYLKRIRLEGARRDILHAPPNAKIARIATNWGFVHMGRFSMEYRSRFGVNPAADLRRDVDG